MGVIFFCPATRVDLMLEDRWEGYFRRQQNDKRTCVVFGSMKH